jgi:(p)ppGpp synthase/HD superfamily hydrolase
LNHLLRVASIIATDVPDATDETFTIAFLHNMLEVSSVSPEEIKTRFGHKVSSAIQALTIDRNRKDKSYLKEYYSRIEATSVACADVKVVDKLDNIYMICFNPSPEIRSSYLDEIDEWVVPMALQVVPGLGIRLKEVSMIMRRLGFLQREREVEKIVQEAGI